MTGTLLTPLRALRTLLRIFPLLHVGHTAKYYSRCCMLVKLPSIFPVAACWSHCQVLFPLLHVGYTAKYCSHCCMLVTLPSSVPAAACWSHCYVFFPLLHVGHTAKYCSHCCMLVTLAQVFHSFAWSVIL
jgi:hypothetical protein